MASPLTDLSQKIADDSALIDYYLSSNNLPPLSVGKEGPYDFPSATPSIRTARARLRTNSKRLHDLVVGPSEQMRWLGWHFHDYSTLQYINTFALADHVPPDSPITFAALAAAAGVNEGVCKRMLRYAMTYNVFREPSEGSVEHTGASMLLRQPFYKDMLWHLTEDGVPASAVHVAAIRKWGPSEVLSETAFTLSKNPSMQRSLSEQQQGGDGKEGDEKEGDEKEANESLTFFDHIFSSRRNRESFSGFMNAIMSSDDYNVRHLVTGFDWSLLPPGATVVDVGGNVGHASIAICKSHPHLRFIVQDLEDMSSHPDVRVPESLASQITFQAHDFWTEQPVKEKAVYLLRHILHDYPDRYAVKILKNLVPALRNGARVVIKDAVVPSPGVLEPAQERILRTQDLHMHMLFQAKERELGDWKALLGEVDGRLRLVNVVKPEGSLQSVLEVVFVDEDGPRER